MRRCRLPLIVGLLLAAVPVTAVGAAVPVVIAVDTSRSLSASEEKATTDYLARVVGALPDQTPVGLVEFNDAPRWVVASGSSPAAVRSALAGLAPAGRLTVLRDALFLAAKELRSGGIILLATDGRDEDSATTVEDMARIATDRHVRVVALGIGHRIDERAMRRIALLTGGEYLGRLQAVSTATVAESIERASHAVAGETTTSLPPSRPEPMATAVPSPVAPPPPPPASHGVVDFLLPALAVLALAGGIVTVLLLRSRRARAERTCPRCGAELAAWEMECPHCQIEELQEHLKADAANAELADESLLDPSVFEKIPLEERLEKTFALGEQAVLIVKERRKPPRSYMLHTGKAFSIGRAGQVNTLAFDDPTLSGQHLKIVSKDGDFFVVDLGSTNGTIVNGDRVKARRLKNGDVIRAGEIELEFRIQYMRTA